MRTLYLLASYLLTPLLLLHMAWRSLRDRGWRQGWSERFGLGGDQAGAGGIVLHAASVGEINAAVPLIRALQSRYPEHSLTLTCFTPTGWRQLDSLFAGQLCYGFAPLDLPGCVRRFFSRVKPQLLVVMETEIWPEFFYAAEQRGIPIVLANARISPRSFSRYQRLQRLVAMALGRVSAIAAQSEADAGRFISLGAAEQGVSVSGNLKFELELPAGLLEQGRLLRQSWGEHRPVLVAGSVREADEQPLLQAFAGIREQHSEALLVLAPRHPERFEALARLAREAGFSVHLHSNPDSCLASANCLLVDAMGVLLRYYAAGDVAFVGGSFGTVGGHNVLEPAALGKPVLFGPNTRHVEQISSALLEGGAARCVRDAPQLQRAVLELLEDEGLRRSMGVAGQGLVRNGQGALGRTLEIIDKVLEGG